MKERFSVYKLLIVLITVTAILTGCGNQPGTLEGTVTHVSDGQPVAGAQVSLFTLEQVSGVSGTDTFKKGTLLKTLETDQNGSYSTMLEPGKYVVEVQAEGQQETSRMIEVKGGQSLKADFGLASP